MVDRGLVAQDNIPCQCEHGNCPHALDTDAACPFFAERNIYFPGAGTFSVCVRCQNHYHSSGYRFVAELTPVVNCGSQSTTPRRKTDDESTSISEYKRRERDHR